MLLLEGVSKKHPKKVVDDSPILSSIAGDTVRRLLPEDEGCFSSVMANNWPNTEGSVNVGGDTDRKSPSKSV